MFAHRNALSDQKDAAQVFQTVHSVSQRTTGYHQGEHQVLYEDVQRLVYISSTCSIKNILVLTYYHFIRQNIENVHYLMSVTADLADS